MKRKKLTISILAIVLIAVILPFGYIAYSISGGNAGKSDIKAEPEQQSDSLKNDSKKTLPASKNAQGIADAKTIDIKKPSEGDIDISKIDISKDIADSVRNSDSKNYDKNINNYKKVLVKFNVPKEHRNQLEKLMKKGKKMPDILTLYDFLNDNYGTISELESMVDELGSGEKLGDVLRKYNSTHPEFVPTKFDDTYLQNLMKTMPIDDILIADRISQKGLEKFDDLIAKRKSGASWKDINASLGIINTSDQLPRMSLTSSQVKKCMQDNNMNQKDATDVLIMTWRTGKDYSSVTDELKSGKKKEDIYAEAYNEKYK